MANRSDRELREWLEAEAAGDQDRADTAFASVFAGHVSALEPPAPLWDELVVRRAVGARHRRWLAAAAALLLTVGGLAAATFWSAWVFDLAGAASVAGPRVLAVCTAVGHHLFDLGRHAWLPAVAIGRALAVAAATGSSAVVIGLNLSIAFSAALALSRLLSPEEE
jgi:hypothetical protein